MKEPYFQESEIKMKEKMFNLLNFLSKHDRSIVKKSVGWSKEECALINKDKLFSIECILPNKFDREEVIYYVDFDKEEVIAYANDVNGHNGDAYNCLETVYPLDWIYQYYNSFCELAHSKLIEINKNRIEAEKYKAIAELAYKDLYTILSGQELNGY